jgi:hypothetical protein
MDGNAVEDILSQALEYEHTLRQELDFNLTGEQEEEITGQSGSAGADGQGAQGRNAAAGGADGQGE